MAKTAKELKDELHGKATPAPPQGSAAAAPAEGLTANGSQVPQAPEVELAVLGGLYLYPRDCFPLFTERGRTAFFVNPIHREFFSLLSDYFAAHRQIDPTAFVQHVADAGKFERIGGGGFLASVLSNICGPTTFPFYLDILRDKYVAREAGRLSRDLSTKLAGATDEELWPTISEHEHAIADLRALSTDKMEGVENFAYADLIGFDAKADPTVLLGASRWLGRGYTCLWAGGSGYGKSTLEMQAALYWATGTPFFGIKPVRPLKSLILQAENDLGDTGEQFQGVLAGIKATGDVNLNGEVERMFVVNRLIGCTGERFLARLKSLLKLHKPDLVWIDPLFAFAGCDLIDTQAISSFLRNGLIPIVVEHGVCAHVIHHIGKPARENDSKKGWTAFDYQFLGFGSSEIQNAFRAVNILIPVSGHEGMFRLILSKRGARAGATDVEGEHTTSLYLTHAKEGGILWSQVEKPEEQEKQKRNTDSQFQGKFTQETVLEEMSLLHGSAAAELQKRLKEETGMSEKTFYRFWAQLKETGKIQIGEERKWFIKSTPKL